MKKLATELQPGDQLIDGATIIGKSLAESVPLGEPNNPNAEPFDHAKDVAYPIRYIDGGDGVRVYAKTAEVTVD